MEIVVPTSKLEESIRLRHRLDGGVEFLDVELDEVGAEMIFRFMTDDETFVDEDFSDEISEDII